MRDQAPARSFLLSNLSGDRVGAADKNTAAHILALADKVRRLAPPGHRDPERFWREKSEIAAAIRQLARERVNP